MNRTISTPASDTSASTASVGSIIAMVLLIVGGLNWALVGLFDVDLVALLFGAMTVPSRIIYVLVGLAAVYALTLLPRLSRKH
jgi:uncharacterized protein